MTTLEIDVHGFSKDATVRAIQNLIRRHPEATYIEVIHGYHNGCAIKNLLSNKCNIHSSRVLRTLPVPFNDGRTMIILKR